MTTQEIVSKLWNLCNVLRDDGITYHQYVTELTYILFLKMAKETGAESQIPAAYRWDQLTAKSGIELKKFYKELLAHLGENCTGRVAGDRTRALLQTSTSPRIWKRSSPPLMAWTGTPPGKRGWATCMKGCWRRTPMKRSPAQASTSPLVSSLM